MIQIICFRSPQRAMRFAMWSMLPSPNRRGDAGREPRRFAGAFQNGPEQPPDNPPEPTAVQTTTSIPEVQHVAAEDVIEINPAELNVDDWDVAS